MKVSDLAGRPIADKVAERIRAALAEGMSVRRTAAKFEVNPSTVQRIARPFGGAGRKHWGSFVRGRSPNRTSSIRQSGDGAPQPFFQQS